MFLVDLNAVAGFQWDDGNAHKSHDKHDVSPSESEQVFFNQPLFLVENFRHSSDESRFRAFGATDAAR